MTTKEELIALWNEYEKTINVIMDNRSPFEGVKKAMLAGVPENYNYPPVHGLEEVPYKQHLKLRSGEKNEKKSKKE
jgi:hypothetical protein